jgi:hypothetical protein
MIALTAARQFLGQRGRQVVLGLGGAGALAMAVMIVLSDNFFIVIGGYSVAMLFLLALNLAALRRQPGAAAMVAGVVITFAASALPLVGYQGFAGLGVYGDDAGCRGLLLGRLGTEPSRPPLDQPFCVLIPPRTLR